MKTIVQNRINMLTTVSGVTEKHKDTWKDHVAFAEGADGLTEKLGEIDAQAQIAAGNSGAAEAKKLARAVLGIAANEITGAVGSYATKITDPTLTAKVSYAPSDVVAGKPGAVVARCRTIHIAANGIVGELGNYGITAAKLAAFKKKIDAFDNVKTAPREDLVARSAATLLLPQLTRSAVGIVHDEMDGLMAQFKEANPNFYEEYFAARQIVNTRGGQSEPEAAKVIPLSTPVPLEKAA